MLALLASLLTLSPLCAWWAQSTPGIWLVSLFQYEGSNQKGNVYNILWALVFGFATLNILGLVARRFEPNRNRLSFGETIAIMVVIVSIALLGWEMLTLFKVFPIKLQRHG